jgi:hypothetical protein
MANKQEVDEFVSWLKSADGGFAEVKIIRDGDAYAAIKPLLFHWTMVVGAVGDDVGYDDRWCYATEALARQHLDAWDGVGEPDGWHRHPRTGRRRDNGDPETQYVSM